MTRKDSPKIGDFLTLQRGFDITKKEQSPGSYPVVSSGGVASYHNEYKATAPGVVIGRKGTLGTAFYLESDYWPHDTSLWVKDFKGNSPNYIYYYLKALPLERLDSGSANPTLNRNVVHQLDATFPTKATQQKIAKVLSTLDAKIELNNRINGELEAMAKLLYDYWFVQFDFPMTAVQATALGQPELEGQPYKASGGKMVFNKTLKREIPEGWEAGTLDEALTLSYGKALKKEIQKPGPYPVYGSNGIYGFHESPLVEGPGIIVGRKGTVGSVTWEHGDFFATDTSYYVETKSYYSMSYAFHLLKSLRLDLMNTDSAVPGLSRTYAYMRKFATPPQKQVEAFTTFATPLRDQIHNNQKQNQELTELRDWLLPMLMNGQVTVGD